MVRIGNINSIPGFHFLGDVGGRVAVRANRGLVPFGTSAPSMGGSEVDAREGRGASYGLVTL